MAEKDLIENHFRDEIFEYLLSHGYVESKKADYDYKNAIDVAKLFDFLEASQTEELQKFKNHYKSLYKEIYIDLLCKKIDSRGLLTAMNEWVEDYASNTKFSIIYFKSGLSTMSDNLTLYEENIFSVRRELTYEDKAVSFRVDLALFINGIPIVMIELKKQTAGQKAGFEGTKQFKHTRSPDELIFSFNKRTLVYFALDELVAFVTTRLDRKETKFLPFNIGDDEGAGNPVADGNHSTNYLWEKILQKDMLLRIIREFMFIDDEKMMIFPRYHQLNAVLRAERDVKDKGIGGRYLIWHSAGSGKTKTISWLARRLINNSDINTVIIISDRTVIDGQLGSEVKTLDGQSGVAQHIDTTSNDLMKRINDGGYIIVTTLQKFRPILNEIKQYKNRKYAIIIDEAHSSAAGKSMSKASETLTGKSLKDAVEIEDIYDELEDDQNQLLKNKSLIESTKNVSYFVFTATPKSETMELFGTRNEIGKTYFDKYSMKQAIDEKFILNPLLCYTNYTDEYEIKKKKEDYAEYDSARAQAAILNYVTTSKEVIDKKVQIIMDDFTEYRINWLGGKAKAMVITPSRKHAVCYKQAIDEYLKKHECNFKSCVAFTGAIDIDGVKFTEEIMNKEFTTNTASYDIKKIIANNDDLRIIVVADKLQTGFDENKLSIMYVDKKLGSAVKAVQTLSRINRFAENKKTFVLDFVNKADDIKSYFNQYYGGELYLPSENETNPNILYTKRDKIFAYNIFTLQEVENIYNLITSGDSVSPDLTSCIAKVSKSYSKLNSDDAKMFIAEINKFSKLFYYISTLYDLWNKDMNKLAKVFETLYKVLYLKEDIQMIKPEDLVELIKYSTNPDSSNQNLMLVAEDTPLYKLSTDTSLPFKTFSPIDDIIEKFNIRYSSAKGELTNIIDTLSADESLLMNVRDSSQSAYESVVSDKVASKITDGLLDGTQSGDDEKASFYAELSSNKTAVLQIANAVVRKIKDLLLAG